jgi:hypothetical protein
MEKFDSFTGIIEQLMELRQPVPKNQSPFRNCEVKGPYKHKPAEPLRSELKQAVDVFLPIVRGATGLEEECSVKRLQQENKGSEESGSSSTLSESSMTNEANGKAALENETKDGKDD